LTELLRKSKLPKARYNAEFGDFKNLTEPKPVHAPKAGALPAALHPGILFSRQHIKNCRELLYIIRCFLSIETPKHTRLLPPIPS